MPDDSNGNYSLPNGYLAVTGEKVLPSNHNPPLEDIAVALTARYSRDGRAPMLGNVPMNGFLVTGMGDGVADTDAVTKKQLDDASAGISSDIAYIAEKIATKSADYQAVKADNATSFRFTAAATLSFIQADDSDPDVPGLGANWHCEVWAVDGAVTLDPNGSETINGTATLIVQQGQKATIFCTGSAFFAVITSDALSGPQLRGYTFGLALTTNVSDAANDVDIAAGAAASDTSPFYLMQLASALTKRIDAAWAVGTNQGGLDTGTVGNNTYYIWLIQRSDTLVTDALFSLSSTAPTMPTNYDRKRLLGLLVRSAGANGTPQFTAVPYGIKSASPVTLSGVANLLTGIPAGVRRVTLTFSGLTTSAAAQLLLQIGPSSGVVTTGYLSSSSAQSGSGTLAISSTTAFVLGAGGQSGPTHGTVSLNRHGSTNTWEISGNITLSSSSGAMANMAGGITLSDNLERINLTTAAGTPTFSGAIALSWEF